MMTADAAASTKKKTGSPIDINWLEMWAPPASDPVEVCFAPAAVGRGKRKEARERVSDAGLRGDAAGMLNDVLPRDIADMSDFELLKHIAEYGRMLRPFRKYMSERIRRLRPLIMDEARSRGIDVSAAEDVDERAKKVYTFDLEDEGAEYASKYCAMPSPIRSTKRNYGQLGVSTRRSLRQAGQRNAIPVEKMYSSKSSSKTLYRNKQGVHALDSDSDDGEKCRRNGNNSYRKSTKRREVQHRDSSPLHFQKVQHVVLLDDDVQPGEPGDCGVPDEWNELKIYYPSRDDPEAVELTSSAIKCLDPGVCLSSPVINYFIQHIKRKMLNNEDHRDKFHIFNTYFYSKLPEALLGENEFLKLRRWWKGVNIFQRAYIILPIHGMAHWSLIIICIPAKESNSGPIILHLDSLGMHPSAEIFGKVARYLEAEWCHLRKNPPSDISISETIWEDLPRNIHNEIVQVSNYHEPLAAGCWDAVLEGEVALDWDKAFRLFVPGQTNAYDCGIFMLYYIIRFIREAPDRFTRDRLGMFGRSWFESEDASGLRTTIRKLLLKEFESAMADDAMPDAVTSDGSDEEGIIMEGESEAVAPCDNSEMVIGGADTSISDEGIAEVGSLEERAHRSHDTVRDCVLSEAATFSDGKKDDTDTMKADSDISETEQEIDILPSDRPKNNEEVTHTAPDPDIYCDISDNDMDDVKIIEVRKQKPCTPFCCIS